MKEYLAKSHLVYVEQFKIGSPSDSKGASPNYLWKIITWGEGGTVESLTLCLIFTALGATS